MFRSALVAILLTTPSWAQDIAVPSGHDVSVIDVILEEPTQTARFRFLMPAIGATDPVAYADVLSDFEYLCNAMAIPGLAAHDWAAKDIVISLASETLPFGTVTDTVTQYFQPFRVENDTCIWEDF